MCGSALWLAELSSLVVAVLCGESCRALSTSNMAFVLQLLRVMLLFKPDTSRARRGRLLAGDEYADTTPASTWFMLAASDTTPSRSLACRLRLQAAAHAAVALLPAEPLLLSRLSSIAAGGGDADAQQSAMGR